MFKEPGAPQETEPEQEGLSQKQVDRIYEEAFRETHEALSDIADELRGAASAAIERLGYRIEDMDGMQSQRRDRYAFEFTLYPEKDDFLEEVEAIVVELQAGVRVDPEAAEVTLMFEPRGDVPAQPRLEEAKRVMEHFPRTITLRASKEKAAEMKAFAEDRTRQAEENREGMKRFRAFAEANLDRELTPEDFRKNFEALRHAPIPDVDKGIWEIRKLGDRWRFVWYDKNEANGATSIRDVIEFGDGE